MTLEQMYAAIGGDYKAVMERLPSADFVRRFALKFLQDDSFPNLKRRWKRRTPPRRSVPPTPSRASARTLASMPSTPPQAP